MQLLNQHRQLGHQFTSQEPHRAGPGSEPVPGMQVKVRSPARRLGGIGTTGEQSRDGTCEHVAAAGGAEPDAVR